MGSCCCSFQDEEAPELEEQARLLEPPGEWGRASTSDSQSCQDEQTPLSSIMNKVANSIIDVAAAQSMRLGNHEYVARTRSYRNRLAELKPGVVSAGGVGGSCSRFGSRCGRFGSRCGRLGGSCGRLGRSCGRLGHSSVGGVCGEAPWSKKARLSTPLLSFTSHPHLVLAGPLVPYADVLQASRIAADAHRAMQHVRVQPQEELVVQFEVV